MGPVSIRVIFHTIDGHTALHALSPPFVKRVATLRTHRADDVAVAIVTHEDNARNPFKPSIDRSASVLLEERSHRTQFEWQMNQFLGHPAMIEMRQKHVEAATAFAVVLWESIRYMCRKDHMVISPRVEELTHPIALSMLHAGLLAPRW